MKQKRKVLTWRLISALSLVLLLLVLAGPVAAEGPMDDSALMKPPARDAAFVAELPGFQTVTAESFTRKLSLPEGLVIRQSRVENGKIIIPPSGLYYTTRQPLALSLQGDQLVILGKSYYFVDYGTRLDVIKDVDFKLGDCAPIGDGTKCFELSSIDYGFAGKIPGATFQILKPSGNYYGADFPVRTSPLLFDPADIQAGTDNPAGSLLPGEPTDWQTTYYASPVATSGQTYVIADEVTPDGAHLIDAGTGAINWLWVTETKPAEAVLGAGETMEVGDYTVKVVEVDAAAKTAEIQIMQGNEELASATFGPLTDEMFNYLPEDPMARAKLSLAHDDSIYVHLDAFREPFREDKVALVGYSDLIKFNNPDEWPGDSGFIVRPDT